jgi:hypothetical protein
MTKPLLICYPPGARGDFLAAVLTNAADHAFTTCQLGIDSSCYKKIHSTENPIPLISQTELDQYYSIRIQVSSIDHLLTVAYQWYTKQVPWKPELSAIPEIILNCEQAFDLTFDQIVPVSDLWDIERIKALYYQFTQLQLTPERTAVILGNIRMQQWITLDNYKEYFPKGVDGLNTLWETLHNE